MDYSAANVELWNSILQIGIIAFIVIISNVLRLKVPFVKKTLMPTAVLGGFLLLGLKYLDIIRIDTNFLEILTYHCLGIGFIALSLRVSKKDDSSKSDFRTAVKSGATIVSTYSIQGVVGLLVSIFLAYTFMPDLFKASGLLLPMGFGQGPGQGNNIGSSYEKLGFAGGRSFGLAIAATGFIVACLVGVIYLNIGAKKGKFKRHSVSQNSGENKSVTIEDFLDKDELPVSHSIDRLTIQIGLIFLVYMVTYLFLWGFTSFLSKKAPAVDKLVSSMLWGFNFLFGTLFAYVFKLISKGFKKFKVMRHQYQNNYLLNRISGLAFDVMIVCGIGTINFEDLKGLWIPFIIMSILGGLVTFIHLKIISKKIYKGYEEEGFLSMFGMLTGTISSGVLLVREIDNNFETPAANNLVTGTSTAVIFGIPIIVLVGLAPKSTGMTFIVLGICLAYYACLMAIIFSKTNDKLLDDMSA
ncbi:MAG: hypothetical protein K5866_08070 [Treponema sp.]|nr:hypothetical protein [Treponema sp.]